MNTRERISLSAAITVLIIGLSMAFLSGCGTDYYCDAVSANGLCIKYESTYIPPEAVDDALNLTWLLLRDHYKLGHKRYKETVLEGSQITVAFKDDVIECQYGQCMGIAILGARLIEVFYSPIQDCLSDTALVHEFLHLIPHLMGIGSDGNHEDHLRWETIDSEVNSYLRDVYCVE
jgi:hypothetical protein